MARFQFSPEFDPLNALLRLQREFEQVFENPRGFDMSLSGRGVFPPVNILQDAEGTYVVRFEMPGVALQDISIESHGRTLVLSGKRDASTDPNGGFHRRERGAGQFSRSFQFPTELDLDRAEASYKQGLLTLRIPKHAAAKPRQIIIEAA